jgi:hypothetical protein
MLNFDDNATADPIFAEPKGSVSVNCINGRLDFYSNARGQYLFQGIDPADVFDEFGVSYGATAALVRTAINPFLNFFF